MSIPNNNQNHMGSGSPTSAPAIPISTYHSQNYNLRSSTPSDYSNPAALGINYYLPNITTFRLPSRVIVYEFYNHPIVAAIPSFTTAGIGTVGPRAPIAPFMSARALVSYERSSTLVPRATSSSISLGRCPRQESQFQGINDQASSSSLVRRVHEEATASESTKGEHKCYECGKAFQSGPALGGHMSSHSKRRRTRK